MQNLKLFGMMPGKKMTRLVKESTKDVLTISLFINYSLNLSSC